MVSFVSSFLTTVLGAVLITKCERKQYICLYCEQMFKKMFKRMFKKRYSCLKRALKDETLGKKSFGRVTLMRT